MMESNGRFLHKTFRRFVVPAVFSVLGATVNVMVDSIIVGNLLGTDALAAVSLCAPIFLLFSSLGALIGGGAGTLSSIYLGKNDPARARECYTVSIRLALCCSAVLTVLGLLFFSPVLHLLCARESLLPLVREYAGISILGAVPKILLYIPFGFLRLDGKPRQVCGMLLGMAFSNAALDLLFIRIGWGMWGASLASVLATALSVLMGFFFLRGGSFYRVPVQKPQKYAAEICAIGTPGALNNLFAMFRVSLLNLLLLSTGGGPLVCIFTVVNSISECALCLVSGIPQAAAPLTGIFYGERDNASLRRLVRIQLLYGLIGTAVFSILTALLSAPLCALFGLPDGLAADAAPALFFFAASLPPAAAASILIFFYGSTGRVWIANFMTACRVLIFAVLPAYLLSFADGAVIWWFFPLSELLALLTALLLARGLSRKNTMLSPCLLLDESLERLGKTIHFSVGDSMESVVENAEKISGFCEANQMTSKQTMAVSLSIEEMLSVIIDRCFCHGEEESADIRVFAIKDEIGLRIRYSGPQFNPIKFYEAENARDDALETLGIQMIVSMAKLVQYQYLCGVNTLLVRL